MKMLMGILILCMVIGSAQAVNWQGTWTATATPMGTGPASGAPYSICINIEGTGGTLGECSNPIYDLSEIKTPNDTYLSGQFRLDQERGSLSLWWDDKTKTCSGTLAFDDGAIGRIDIKDGKK